MNAWKALILNQSSKRVDHLHGSSYLVRFEHLFYVWSIIYHQFSFLALKTNKWVSHACPPIHFSRFASLLLPPFHTCPLCHRTLAHPHSWLLCDQQAADLIIVTEFHSNTAQSSQWPRRSWRNEDSEDFHLRPDLTLDCAALPPDWTSQPWFMARRYHATRPTPISTPHIPYGWETKETLMRCYFA